MTTTSTTSKTRTRKQLPPTQQTQQVATPPKAELVEMNPGELIVDTNVRVDTDVDDEFLRSIEEFGVLMPIVGVRTSDGTVRVRFGHRRTMAALKTGRQLVNVVVAGDEATDDIAQIERVLEQWEENETRTGLTLADKVKGVAQLSAFGLPAAEIGRRLPKFAGHVDAALSVARSGLAQAATARYDFLDITQAAAVAEFDTEPETVDVLVNAAKRGQFDQALQRARDARIDMGRRAQLETEARAAGIALVSDEHESAVRLSSLRTEQGEQIDPAAHLTCPGHAVWITTEQGHVDPQTLTPIDDDEQDQAVWDREVFTAYPVAESVCIDPQTHGHYSPGTRNPTPANSGQTTGPEDQEDAAEREAQQRAQRAAATAERRAVIANNAAWFSARTVRQEWLRTLISRKSAPKGAAAFIARAIAADAHVVSDRKGHDLVCKWLSCAKTGYGSSSALVALIDRSSQARAQVIALAQILAAYEARTDKEDWRTRQRHTERFLRFIASCGYALSDVERRACGETPADPANEVLDAEPATGQTDDSDRDDANDDAETVRDQQKHEQDEQDEAIKPAA